MSREIKFRAWDIIAKRMLSWGDIFSLPAWEIFPGTPEQRPFEVMQYTGKRDTKDQEIYESDIIECEYKNGETWRGVVKWGIGEPSFFIIRNDVKSCNCYSVNYGGGYVKRYEVIGNIYENPELLPK